MRFRLRHLPALPTHKPCLPRPEMVQGRHLEYQHGQGDVQGNLLETTQAVSFQPPALFQGLKDSLHAITKAVQHLPRGAVPADRSRKARVIFLGFLPMGILAVEDALAVLEGTPAWWTPVGNQQKWHSLRAERSGILWRSGKLPECPVVASSPFDCLSLYLLPAL